MAEFTVILPHKRNRGNDAALQIAIDALMANTYHDFHLLIDAAVDQPLQPRINRLVAQAETDIVVYTASDIFMARNWDVPMLAAVNERTFVTGILVEPGVMGVAADNVHKDFGRKPETYRRAEFEAWAETDANDLNVLGEGFPCPYMFYRDGWLSMGGLQTDLYSPDGFTDADMFLWERWKAAGNRIQRVKSYAYHIQRYSSIEEQQKAGR